MIEIIEKIINNEIYRIVAFTMFVQLFLFLLFVVLLSFLGVKRYIFQKIFGRADKMLYMQNLPGVSIITGAYNESVTIIDNVHSLISLNYSKFELIIVNDGSTDDTLEKLINEFKLKEVKYVFETYIPSAPIRKIYKSEDLAYSNLIVVDKENGGCKADAINAGLNISKYDYFLNIDVDCILHFDTLLRMMEAVMNEEKRCIGVGATLRMSNSSVIHRGTMVDVITPKNLFVRFQELEYMRSFVLGKTAWSVINAVPNISGGLGLFDKEIVIKVGAYDKLSLGEDMDLVFRMIRYMREHNEPYVIRHIPETLCWTEGPDNLKILVRQRIRWSRGLLQILKKNRKVLFNPKYGILGFVIYPYNLFFEFLSPFIEIMGVFLFFYYLFYNQIILHHLFVIFFTVYTFYIGLSFFAVFLDRQIGINYRKRNTRMGIALMAFIEPLLYHPIILYSSLRGYFDEVIGKKKKWGEMARKGFKKQ